MSSHTPGPWFHNRTEKPARAVWNTDGDATFPEEKQKIICHLSAFDKWSPSSEETDANMQLIAAAPDLLAACQAALAVLPGLEVRSWPPGHELKRKVIESLKAAIEKAAPTAHSPPGESR